MKIILAITILIASHFYMNAQVTENVTVTPFEISITIADDEVLLQGIEGTAWTDLSFLLKQGSDQVINNTGISTIAASDQLQEDENSFCFTIKRTENGMALTSNYGTAWQELRFSLKNYSTQRIDHHGMIIE